MVIEHGITFIGPSPDHIRLMGDKIQAKETMKSRGVPVVPGTDGPVKSDGEARAAAEAIGYPVPDQGGLRRRRARHDRRQKTSRSSMTGCAWPETRGAGGLR